MEDVEAYRALRVAVTASLQDIEEAYLKQRAISEEALAAAVSAGERNDHEARLRKLELAYEIARGRVLDDTRDRHNTAALKRYKTEIIMGVAGVAGVIGIGLYLYLTNHPPAAPELLAETPSTPGEVHLSWRTSEKKPVKAFILTRKDVQQSAEKEIQIQDGKLRSYVDAEVEPNTQYEYRIVADNEIQKSPPSKTVQVQTPLTVPKQPLMGSAEPGAGDKEKSLHVKWVLLADASVVKTRLERSDDGGKEWKPLTTFDKGRDTGEHLDNNLTPDTEYTYRVVAVNAAGETASPLKQGRTYPEPPAGLKAQANPDFSVRLTWQSIIKPGSTMVIRTASAEHVLTPQETSKGEWVDTGLEPGSTRQYLFMIRNEEGVPSEARSVTVVIPPVPPSGVKVSEWKADSCTIEWDRALTGAKSFEVFRADDKGEYQSIGSVGAPEARYVDKTVKRGGTYSYKVAARNTGGLSELSAATEQVKAVLPKPQAPRLSVKPAGVPGAVQVSWALKPEDAGALQKLVIERATTAEGPFSPIKDVAAPVGEQGAMTDQKEILEETEYFYRAQAFAQDYDTPFTSALESVVIKKQVPARGPAKTRRRLPVKAPAGPAVLFGTN
ncbi:MAG: fibronectin type III domain-containing protein [Candidatus Sumerlaeaceae bacterium]